MRCSGRTCGSSAARRRLPRLLIIYPIAIALLIGLALSSSPALPRVAFLNEIPPDQATVQLGRESINTTAYERRLFQAIQPVPVATRAQAIADVRSGATIAALIIPAALPQELASASQTAYVDVIYNNNAVNQSLVEQAIESKLAQANAALAAQLSRVADSYIDLLLKGGNLNFLGATYKILGLVRAHSLLQAITAAAATLLAGAAAGRAGRELRGGGGPAPRRLEGGDRRGCRTDRRQAGGSLGSPHAAQRLRRRRRGVGQPDVRLHPARLGHARARARGGDARPAATRPRPRRAAARSEGAACRDRRLRGLVRNARGNRHLRAARLGSRGLMDRVDRGRERRLRDTRRCDGGNRPRPPRRLVARALRLRSRSSFSRSSRARPSRADCST